MKQVRYTTVCAIYVGLCFIHHHLFLNMVWISVTEIETNLKLSDIPVDDVGYLWDTALMLELGWKKSRSNSQLQLMLLKIYGELGTCLLFVILCLCWINKNVRSY